MSKKIETQTYERFPVWRRIEHIIMVLSFSTLGLTGIPQKYPSSTAGAAILQALGGIENLRFIHHTAAIVMMFGTAWHILVMGYSVFKDRTGGLFGLYDVGRVLQGRRQRYSAVKHRFAQCI